MAQIDPSAHMGKEPEIRRTQPTLRVLVLLFFKLGTLGFGGGMAVVALMEDELVQRRKLMDQEEFLHGLALGQILGSFATNAAFFVGSASLGSWAGSLARLPS